MIDWNGNGKIDPEEVVLTEIICSDGEEPPEDEETTEVRRTSAHSGCLLNMLLLPILVLLGGWKR